MLRVVGRADRSEDSDDGELLLLVGNVVKGERVREPEGRHVEENVKQKHQDEERAGISERRCYEHRQPAEYVQNAEHALGGKETIRHHAKEKG